MKLYLVRHGRTNYNVKKIRDDNPKTRVPLNKEGLKQARYLSNKLMEKKFDAIFCSQLLRTRQTAEIINKTLKSTILIDKRLNEHNTGFDKKLNSELIKARTKSKNPLEFKPRGAESIRDVEKRVNSFLNDLKKRSYDNILIVTHGCIIERIYKLTNGEDYPNLEKGVGHEEIVELKIK